MPARNSEGRRSGQPVSVRERRVNGIGEGRTRPPFPYQGPAFTRGLAFHPLHHDSPSHAQALSISLASKYWIFAMVNGLQTPVIHFSQVLSPTRAILSIFVQCVVENLMSSHRA